MAQPKNKQPAAQSKPTAKPAPKAASVGTAIEVLQYCESSTATQAAKLTYLEANVSGIFKDLLATLMGQVSYRAPGSVAPDPKEYIQRMYMLHNVLIGILENPDDAERTALLHVVNLVFEQYGGVGEAFSPYTLLEHDYNWSWGLDSLHAFQFIVVIIAKLANPVTRPIALRTINLNSQVYSTTSNLSDTAISNFIAFYTA